MAIRPIVYWPDKRLLQETQEVTSFDASVKDLAVDLVDSMHAWGGIGIAAPQIGETARVFVLTQELQEDGLIKWNGAESNLKSAWVFVNPEIVRIHPQSSPEVEGCLSFPNIFINVSRYQDVVVEAVNVEGGKFSVSAGGLLGRAIQHETDHCFGKTMMDYVGRLKRDMVSRKLRKWRRRNGIG